MEEKMVLLEGVFGDDGSIEKIAGGKRLVVP